MGAIISGLFGSSAANKLATQAQNAENGVTSATTQGNAGVSAALGANSSSLNNEVGTAVGQVNNATAGANSTLNSLNASEQGNLNPYLQGGQQGATALTNYALSNPQFTNASVNNQLDMPALQFQMQQGSQAIQNSAAAQGLGNSGATLKNLTQYGQGLASTYYNQAFNQAQSQFQTNQNATLSNLGTLVNMGQGATAQSNQAAQNSQGQVAANTLGAGVYAGNAGLQTQDLLAGQNLQGSEFEAGNLQTGAENAGNFALDLGEAQAGGQLALGNGIGSGVNALLGAL
jgi:hypothetical protein